MNFFIRVVMCFFDRIFRITGFFSAHGFLGLSLPVERVFSGLKGRFIALIGLERYNAWALSVYDDFLKRQQLP